MSDAPAWIADVLERHQTDEGFYGDEGHEVYRYYACVCGWWSTADGEKSHRFHVAQELWDAFPLTVLQIPEEQLEGQIPLPTMILRGEEGPELTDVPPGRVIPSRATDPVTSHKAAAAVTVKAGSQRAALLTAFWLMDRDAPGIDGATDEEAMRMAGPTLVNPLSEYSKRCSELREAGLIEPLEIEVQLDERTKYTVPGFFGISEQRFAKLDSGQLERLNKPGFLHFALFVLASMGNLHWLIELKNRKRAAAQAQGVAGAGKS
jgi:hypothetical protein